MLLPEGAPDDKTRRGYIMVATAATLFAVNGSVSKVVLGSGLSSLELAQIRNPPPLPGRALRQDPALRRHEPVSHHAVRPLVSRLLSISSRLPPGRNKPVASIRYGAFHSMPAGLPLIETCDILTLPRSSQILAPWNQLCGAVTDREYVAVPGEYFTPSSVLAVHGHSPAGLAGRPAPPIQQVPSAVHRPDDLQFRLWNLPRILRR